MTIKVIIIFTKAESSVHIHIYLYILYKSFNYVWEFISKHITLKLLHGADITGQESKIYFFYIIDESVAF